MGKMSRNKANKEAQRVIRLKRDLGVSSDEVYDSDKHGDESKVKTGRW